MSAGTELDKGAIARGLLVPKQRTAPAVRSGSRPADAIEMRGQYPLAMLSRDHNTVCTHAVDPAEIAATLEAAGLNDRLVRERYRMGNVFELSRQLYELVPRRESAGPAASDPWRLPLHRHLLRGALYVLPMLPYVVLLRLLHPTTSVVVTLLVGNVVSMAATQAVSHLAHVLKGFGSPRSAARALRAVVLATAAIALALDAVSAATHVLPLGAVAVCGCQLLYVTAATVLLVFDRDRLLMASLLPVMVVSLGAAIVGDHRVAIVAAVALAAALCVVVMFVWTTIRAQFTAGAGGADLRIGLSDLRGALIHAAYGGVTAGLLMYAITDAVGTRGLTSHGFAATGMLPLALSLGVAEAQLYGFRSDCTVFLRTTNALEAFARRVRVAMALRALRYFAVVAAMSLCALTVLRLTGGLETVGVLRHIAYAELGIGLLGATVLVSCQLVGRAVTVLFVALLADLIPRAIGTGAVAMSLLHVGIFAALAGAVWSVAAVKLASPFRHR